MGRSSRQHLSFTNFAEDDAIAGERRAAGPILNDLDQLEPPGGHLLDYEVDGNAVATPILRDTFRHPWPQPGKHRRRVDDREHTARTQDAQEVSVRRQGIAKLKGLSEKLIVSHWENHYGGAVRRLNAIAVLLGEIDFAKARIFVVNGLKREELIATNSMILHELYFDSLGGDGISGGVLDEALKRDFQSVDRWRAEFVAMGKALRGGAGWVFLTYSYRDRMLVNQWAADQTHALAGGTPILALDMYEQRTVVRYRSLFFSFGVFGISLMPRRFSLWPDLTGLEAGFGEHERSRKVVPQCYFFSRHSA